MLENSSTTYIGEDLETLAATPRYQDWIIDQFRLQLRGRAAEYGAGAGTISARLLPMVDSLDLIEPSVNLHPKLKARFADEPKVKIFGQTVEQRLGEIGDNKYDAIVMVNVLEHIEDDEQALLQLRATLVPGGHLLLFVPAMSFLFSALDEYYGHYRRYTKKSLLPRLLDAGFVIERVRYMDVLGILPWYLLNTLGGNIEFNPTLVKLYDTVGIPVTRLVESLMSPPVGKNLMVVSRNPQT